jgi:hypothetical protein
MYDQSMATTEATGKRTSQMLKESVIETTYGDVKSASGKVGQWDVYINESLNTACITVTGKNKI